MSWMDAARAAALGVMLALGACAPQGEAVAESGMRIDEVTVETANGPARFEVEVAATEEQQARGLMFRRELADDRGMLFDFDQPHMAVFWMRNTVIPLDIIFIAPDGRIINIAERATPYSEAPIPADGLTRAVLEIRGGRASELGIRPGDRVRHSIFAG
jgi:uncharacterized protein